jgi:hypothetical protein
MGNPFFIRIRLRFRHFLELKSSRMYSDRPSLSDWLTAAEYYDNNDLTEQNSSFHWQDHVRVKARAPAQNEAETETEPTITQ